MIDAKKIGINVSLKLRREKGTLEIEKSHSFRFYLFWKNKEYPFNFIGAGICTIARELKISEDEARKLVRLRLKALLPTVEGIFLKEAIKKRINEYTPFREIPIKCRRCGKSFVRTRKDLKNCPECKIWYRKNGKYAIPQATKEGITESEKKLLRKLREND